MFIKNTQSKDVKLRSYEGFIFSVPPGVSVIWDKAGEEMLRVHKVESKGGKDMYGFDNGHGVPAIFPSNEKEWEKGGKQCTRVERFQIDHTLIPRANLIKIAKQRGVDNDLVTEYLADSNIDGATIADAINTLAIPDEVRNPIKIKQNDQEKE